MGLGSSLKKAVKQIGGAALQAAGAYYGGPAGASAGTAAGNALGLDTNGFFGNIVQGPVGLGTDYLQSQYNLSQQKDLAAYTSGKQNELNEAAYQRNLQQWNLENAYNSPKAQMERFAEAGLNPNLIYGQNNYAASSPELKPATYNPGEYQPVDHFAQRQALKIALLEHAQRIENQAIQNDLARQELALRIKASEREDKKLDLLKSKLVNLTSTDVDDIQRIYDHDYDMRVKQWKLAEAQHLKNLSFKQAVRNKLGMRNYDDQWYRDNPMPLREVHPAKHVRYYGRRA